MYFIPLYHEKDDTKIIRSFCISLKENKHLLKQIEADYYKISNEMNRQISKCGRIHTISGQYLQIRSKDSNPYTPIYSNVYRKYVSDKYYAFYFKKIFIKNFLDQY